MEKVKRYALRDGWMIESANGPIVHHEDYAALQQKLDALTAENARMLEDYRDIPEMRRIGAPLTPATDAYLNSVRAEAKAKGVEEYADSLSYQAMKMREIDQPRIRVASVNAEANRAREFAAQLRSQEAK